MLCSDFRTNQSCSRRVFFFFFLASFSFPVHLHKNPTEYLSEERKGLGAMFGPLFPASCDSERKGFFFPVL